MEDGSFSFGPYIVSARQRVLLDGDRPVPLGSRAIDLLVVLVERAGDVVGKDELIAKVWPDTFVEQSNLRVHIAALRRALGDGRAGARYIVNIPGRGYSFVAPVTVSGAGATSPDPSATPRNHARHLLIRVIRTIGRSSVVDAIARQLPERRFVTIVGPGGIGKTTVALTVAQDLSSTYADPVRFVDLSTISKPRSLPAAVASALGIALRPDGRIAGLAEELRSQHALILLDNCEHVLTEAAAFAEAALEAAPRVHILATSREPLRAYGERIHRLGPLGAPPVGAPLGAQEALGYPAVELFIERAAAKLEGFGLTNDNAEIVGDICRRLDGMPLGIEFAAAMVDTFGIHELAKRLHDRFAVLTRGRRTALPRHQTLRVTLDWSYETLTEREQVALRRLAVFRGRFTVDAAISVLTSTDLDAGEVPGVLFDLVAKSLVIAEVGRTIDGYRLLHTTRAYALERLTESGEHTCVAHRHAIFLLDFLHGSEVERETHSPAEWRDTYGHLVDDVRGAFDWAYSASGDTQTGVRLTIESAPIWFRLSLMSEYHEHVTRAPAQLNPTWADATALEIRLTEALGHANWHVSGPGAEMAAAFERTLEIAERTHDVRCQMRAIWGLWSERNVFGDYRAAVRLAEKYESTALGTGDESNLVVSDRMLALSHHFVGRQVKARQHAERTLRRASADGSTAQLGSFQFDLRVGTGAVLSRILWILGFPDDATRTACSAVDLAFELGHTLSQCFALYSACMVAIWTGDRDSAAKHSAQLVDRAAKHALAFWESWGRSYELALSLTCETADLASRPDRNDWRNPICGAQLAEVMTTLSPGFLDGSLLAQVESDPENWCAAEVLRAHGENLLKESTPGAEDAAEDLFRRSLKIARQQDALSWELRTATSFAGLRQRQHRPADAANILAPVLARFTEGHGTADLVTAATLLAELNGTHHAA